MPHLFNVILEPTKYSDEFFNSCDEFWDFKEKSQSIKENMKNNKNVILATLPFDIAATKTNVFVVYWLQQKLKIEIELRETKNIYN